MQLASKFRAAFGRPAAADASTSPVVSTADEKKDPVTDSAAAVLGSGEVTPEHPSEDLQRGVQNVEAVTLAWSKASLISVFLK